MIFCFINEFDNSAKGVIDWIRSIDHTIEISSIKESAKIYPLNIDLNDFSNTEQILNNYSDNISFYYYRRGKFRSYIDSDFRRFTATSIEWLQKEEETLFEYLETRLLINKSYGSINKEKSTNKLINLQLAKQSGFNIPRTLITTSKEYLRKFMNVNRNGTIVKPIRDHRSLKTKNGINYMPLGTKSITDELINNLNEEFFPCLFQEYIVKKFEIRVFFFQENVFPMAIFSQKNPKTQIDFRNYDRELPNRCVPYQLPENIMNNLWKFTAETKYDTGSIDLLLSTDNKYYFLEINHSGNYEWLSENCNYTHPNMICPFNPIE